jgi:DNA-binding PadR family transcriptional regulator
MSRDGSVTAETALLRVLINGECDAVDIVRKVRDWTSGAVDLDEAAFRAAIDDLQVKGLVEPRTSQGDKRGSHARERFALTPDGQAAAMEILAASLTRRL